MTRIRLSIANTGSTLRLAAVVALMAAIFVVDTLTELQIAVAVFYVAVVLFSVSFLTPRGVVLLASVCMALTVVSFALTRSGSLEIGIINCAISLSAIATTTYLALKTKSAELDTLVARAHLARIARVLTLGELTASIAHEVNQPLTAVVASGNACLHWLDAQPPNLAKAEQAVQRIIRDANRASDVVARVRGLANRAPPRKEPLDIGAAVTEIVALTRRELTKNGILLRTNVADTLPEVVADRVQLQQVLLNLILNAIDSMQSVEERHLSIDVDRDAGQVVFAVSDTGLGFEREKHERLFDAFYSSKSGGMGIGLTISRSIVEAHGGRISAEARPGGGATFRFSVPIGRADVT